MEFVLKETYHISTAMVSLLMPFRKIITVYCKNHTKCINILCEQNAEFLYVKAGGTYIDHWALKG
jgi:hypothetical protein